MLPKELITLPYIPYLLIGESPAWILGHPRICHLNVQPSLDIDSRDIPVTVDVLEDGNLHIVYDYPVKAVTPGQEAVLYQGECLGSSIIGDTEPLKKELQALNPGLWGL